MSVSISGDGALTGIDQGLNVVGVLTASGGFSGNLTGNVTGNVNATGLSTFSGGIQVGATTSIVVGSTFIQNNAIGLGATTTTGRNAGVGTATGTIVYNQTSGFVEVYTPGGWSSIGGFTATGGSIDSTSRSGYRLHTFTSPGTFTVTTGSKTVEYLVVAGGGGGGGQESQNGFGGGGGGGGAGGMRVGTLDISINSGPASNGTYTVTVGPAGGGGVGAPSPIVPQGGTRGSNGTDSVFGSITATGGGGGAGDQGDGPGPNATYGAQPGGSGGGRGGDDNGASTVTTGVSGQGNPGSLTAGNRGGGGGGGAGAAGGPVSRQGGIGLQSAINGTSTYYAGGGSGGAGAGDTSTVPGGLGGGGNGSSTNGTSADSQPGGTATAGTTNTGGGGGGGAAGRSQNGQPGGSGIVIIAYPS